MTASPAPSAPRVGRYVCAFRGRRDNYQVPLALAETDRLDQFITDAYTPAALRRLLALAPRPGRWLEKLDSRWEPGISPACVRSLWGTTVREHARHRLGYPRAQTWAELDQVFSRAAARRAQRTKADLLLYSPYAWEAFNESYPGHKPRKILFQYHPHPAHENRVLAEDVRRFPEVSHSYAEATGHDLSTYLQTRNTDCWKPADLIICASAFTRQTLLEAGANPERCEIASYGTAPVPPADPARRDEKFRALFVGSGVQRKGLHHLLLAWSHANLPPGSELTLVCRSLDPGLEPLVARTPAVRLARGVNRQELARLYAASSLFVLPSLIEGFGQVYLEALSHGCPVLGTANTCLPDLGGETDGVFMVPAGNIDALTAKLETLAATLPASPGLRDQAQACARTFTWEKFRERINALL